MQFMDVVIAVLEDLQRQENPCVCKEEIEDLYCMKCRANNLIRQRYWAKAIHKKVRRPRQTNKQVAEKAQWKAKRARFAVTKEAKSAELESK